MRHPKMLIFLFLCLTVASLAHAQQANHASVGAVAGTYAYRDLYDFCGRSGCEDGSSPNGDLISDAAGNLYGTTEGGGNSACQAIGCGTVFRLSPKADGSWEHSVLFEFNGQNGANPPAGLARDGAGNLYGTTTVDRSFEAGRVFRLSPRANGAWKLTTLFTFDRKNGDQPLGRLVLDASGNLYGTTLRGGDFTACPFSGCGTVFRLSPRKHGSWKRTTLLAFNFANGAEPQAGLILDEAGNIYGTTSQGGNSNACGPAGCGTLFRLVPQKDGRWKMTTLHNFQGTDGAGPEGALLFDHAGRLYGTTFLGGDHNGGTVFRLSPRNNGSSKLTTLITFRGRNGSGPQGALLFDPAGNLFGTTVADGGFGVGIVFKLSPRRDGTWRQTTLLTFNDQNGAGPTGGLFLDSAGNLFGSAPVGGKNVGGVVFELSPTSAPRQATRASASQELRTITPLGSAPNGLTPFRAYPSLRSRIPGGGA
jgi:uncharacterized repeat protein (TIGR03803 family)